MSIKFRKSSMSSVAVIIQELFEYGQSSSKICDLLKDRASRFDIYKILKRLKETDSALPKVRSTPSRKITRLSSSKTPERRSEGILEKACKK